MTRAKGLVSGLLHLAGAGGSVAGLVLLILRAVSQGTLWHVISFAIFGTSLVVLYTASTLHHLTPHASRHTPALRRLDHMMIFVLIAGSYMPFCLVPLRGAWGWSVLGGIWGFGILGILLKIFWMGMPRRLSTFIYLLMGWCLVIPIYPLVKTLQTGCLIWIGIGGMCYSVGAVIYNRKRPDPWPPHFGYHEIWHLFVLAGSAAHFWAVYHYISLLP